MTRCPLANTFRPVVGVALAIAVLAVAAAPAEATPQKFRNRCLDATACVFADFLNVALGDATMYLAPSGDAEYPTQLVVVNHASPGFAGVRQYVDSFDMETRLAVPNFSLAPAGAELVGLQRGVVDGESGYEFSRMTITKLASGGLHIDGDWSPINPESYRIDIFLGGELVGSESNLSTGEVLVVEPIDIWIIDCRTPTHLTGTIHPEPIPTATFMIPGRGSYQGDNWVISAMGAEKIAWTQGEIDMFANIPRFGIFDEDTLPGASLADCNHNGVPDSGEVASGRAPDANGDGVPDNCHP